MKKMSLVVSLLCGILAVLAFKHWPASRIVPAASPNAPVATTVTEPSQTPRPDTTPFTDSSSRPFEAQLSRWLLGPQDAERLYLGLTIHNLAGPRMVWVIIRIDRKLADTYHLQIKAPRYMAFRRTLVGTQFKYVAHFRLAKSSQAWVTAWIDAPNGVLLPLGIEVGDGPTADSVGKPGTNWLMFRSDSRYVVQPLHK